jgi:hypothetical protein
MYRIACQTLDFWHHVEGFMALPGAIVRKTVSLHLQLVALATRGTVVVPEAAGELLFFVWML